MNCCSEMKVVVLEGKRGEQGTKRAGGEASTDCVDCGAIVERAAAETWRRVVANKQGCEQKRRGEGHAID